MQYLMKYQVRLNLKNNQVLGLIPSGVEKF